MRVLVVHNYYRDSQPSGENGVVDQETRLLQQAGHSVHTLSVHSDSIKSWPVARRACLPLRVVWSRDGDRLLRTALASAQPDVVHVHNTFPLLSPSVLRAASRSGASVVNTLHNFRPICPAGTLFRDGHVCEDCLGRIPLPSVRHGCYRDSRLATVPIAAMDTVHGAIGTWRRNVDTFVAPSEFTRRKYIEAGWPAEKFAVKYNTAEDTSHRRETSGRGFVCLSRLVAEKGVDVLLRAWAKAFPKGQQRLRILGTGDLESELRTLALTLGVTGVEFCGQLQRDDALDLIRGARAVVVPSLWYEVFPRTVVEAYSLGVPVVASDLGSLSEVVEDGVTGISFAAGSPDSLAAALTAIAVSDELTQRLGRAARSAYDDRYSPDATTTRLVEIYQRAIAHHSPRNATPASNTERATMVAKP